MNTPIFDFVKNYASQSKTRLHMPGHKGKGGLGIEQFDITEIGGADSLYEASGIIAESEKNASEIFGCPTFYSTEGSSQCIRAMLYLACINANNKSRKPLILAGRNAHKTFVTAAAVLDCEVEWLLPEDDESYLSCTVHPKKLYDILNTSEQLPDAVYITSPDYLGNVSDIKGIADVCREFSVPLLVDNAHGAYLKFCDSSMHPIDLGADICCDSAHKTLPVLTGGAYLHISPETAYPYEEQAKTALAMFGSTSPSYLILQSLDLANRELVSCGERIEEISKIVTTAKNLLSESGFDLCGNEKLKITVRPKSSGLTGYEIADFCEENGFICEYADADHVVFMFSANSNPDDPVNAAKLILSAERKEAIKSSAPDFHLPEKAITIRDAAFSTQETIPIEESEGRILAVPTVGCPPAVPIAVCGEKIDKQTIERFLYYGITECTVVK
ncbi:MAG: PLP-dependent transferase [Clostridia bacterium]|nr:PLP-dependent transferase [Clostridia bacterium]